MVAVVVLLQAPHKVPRYFKQFPLLCGLQDAQRVIRIVVCCAKWVSFTAVSRWIRATADSRHGRGGCEAFLLALLQCWLIDLVVTG